jgi:predicted Zn-dependent protease
MLADIPAFRSSAALFAAAIALQVAGCASTTQGGAVGADRSQLMIISAEQLEKMAAQSYSQQKNEAASKGALNKDPVLTHRVREIAERITPVTAIFRKDAPRWEWEVNVVTSKELNAFCMPGGKIIFYSGIIERLKLSDDEIAVIMGHEVAHALREHSREQASQALAAKTAMSVGASLFGLPGFSADLANMAYESLVATSFSRSDESEADRIGIELAARAGYDPRSGVTLWQKMSAQGGRTRSEFTSTHPAEATRIKQIEALLPKVTPLYDAARSAMGARQ